MRSAPRCCAPPSSRAANENCSSGKRSLIDNSPACREREGGEFEPPVKHKKTRQTKHKTHETLSGEFEPPIKHEKPTATSDGEGPKRRKENSLLGELPSLQ